MLYHFFLVRERGKGSSFPWWHIKDPCFSFTSALLSTHIPILHGTKLTFLPRPQIWRQAQQAESQTVMEPDFAMILAPAPALKLKPHVSALYCCSQEPSPTPA